MKYSPKRLLGDKYFLSKKHLAYGYVILSIFISGCFSSPPEYRFDCFIRAPQTRKQPNAVLLGEVISERQRTEKELECLFPQSAHLPDRLITVKINKLLSGNFKKRNIEIIYYSTVEILPPPEEFGKFRQYESKSLRFNEGDKIKLFVYDGNEMWFEKLQTNSTE